MPDLEREFNPAIADCGCRAPLVPRLARQLILRYREGDVKRKGVERTPLHLGDYDVAVYPARLSIGEGEAVIVA